MNTYQTTALCSRLRHALQLEAHPLFLGRTSSILCFPQAWNSPWLPLIPAPGQEQQRHGLP